MIRKLEIEQFVVIESLTLELGEGLNVLSGGSGEGKSLIVDALRFLLGGQSGGRGAAKLVRQGSEEARVRAEVWPSERARDRIVRGGLAEWSEAEGPLWLERSIDVRGRSRITVAGKTVGLATLKALGRVLFEAFGQGAAPTLVEEGRQRAFVDGYGGLQDVVERYSALREGALPVARERDRLKREEDQLRSMQEREAEERDALASLEPEEGEFERLVESLEHMETRREELERIGGVAYSLEEAEGSLQDRLRELIGVVGSLEAPTVGTDAALDALEAARSSLSEAGLHLIRERDAVDLDPYEYERSRERVRAYKDLSRRMGVDPSELAARWDELADQDLETIVLRRDQLEHQLVGITRDLHEAAEALSRRRLDAARQLRRAVVEELPALGLNDAVLEIEVERHPRAGEVWDPQRVPSAERCLEAIDPWSHGRDRVRFTFSANKGVPPAIMTAASGGELSRVFLALGKRVSDRDRAELLVFDEVDSNVGARLGAAVGACLEGMARERQILAITHLAPVAARAHRHVKVTKRGGRSGTEVLTGRERLVELAMMIKGAPVTEAAIQQARELLSEASPEIQRPATPGMLFPSPRGRRRRRRARVAQSAVRRRAGSAA